MSAEQIAYLRSRVLPVLEPYVTRITLFGSMARGEHTPASDVDLVVALRQPGERPSLGLRWFEIEAVLSERLGRPVELVTEEALSPHVRPYIESDRIVLFQIAQIAHSYEKCTCISGR